LAGCPYDPDRVLTDPKIEDLVGMWEGRGIYENVPYSLVEIRQDGSGEVVFSSDEGTEVAGKLSGFKFGKDSFEFEVTGFEDGDETSSFKAQLVYGQICLIELEGNALFEKKGPIWCFVREEKLKKYKRDALNAYKEHKKRNV